MYYSIPFLSSWFYASAVVLDPVVHLSYASYQGVANASNGVTHWLGIRYAAPPLGNLRFAAPEDPPTVSGIQNASHYAPYCIGVGQTASLPSLMSEDCLFLDVFAPSKASNTSALPVFFFIQGGGFAVNANPNFNGRGLVEASGHSIVVVTINYRVGAYGFISGPEVQSPNNGLKDQRKALQWVQQNIAAFGGDPNHVVIGGDSAGAASVSLHLTAYGGKNENLFHAAAAESVSFATLLTVNGSQYLYNNLVSTTGCASSSNSLACLRNLTTAQLQRSVKPLPYPGRPGPALYSWNPVIDGSLIQDHTYRSFNSGAFIRVPTIFGDDTNGGTIFAPKSTNTLNQSNNFLLNQFPNLTQQQIKVLNQLYPNTNLTFPNSGAYWRQLANVYGEMRYMCPGIFISSVYASHNVSAWQYWYNVQDPNQERIGLGVPHTVEVTAIFGPGNTGNASSPASYQRGGSNADIVPLIQGYWTSFIRAFDPNPHRAHRAPVWDDFSATSLNRFEFNTPVSSSAMANLDDGLRGRCEYLWSIGNDIDQ